MSMGLRVNLTRLQRVKIFAHKGQLFSFFRVQLRAEMEKDERGKCLFFSAQEAVGLGQNVVIVNTHLTVYCHLNASRH